MSKYDTLPDREVANLFKQNGLPQFVFDYCWEWMECLFARISE